MRKLRYAVIPFAIFAVAYFFQRTGFRRYGADDPAVPADQIDWGNVLTTWLIATALYFAAEKFRPRRRKGAADDVSSHLER